MNASTAISYSAASVCVFVMFYVCGSCSNFDPYIFEEGAPEDPFNPFESKANMCEWTSNCQIEFRTNFRFAAWHHVIYTVWWKYSKLPIMGGFAALVTGCVYTYYTLVSVFIVKFPGE